MTVFLATWQRLHCTPSLLVYEQWQTPLVYRALFAFIVHTALNKYILNNKIINKKVKALLGWLNNHNFNCGSCIHLSFHYQERDYCTGCWIERLSWQISLGFWRPDRGHVSHWVILVEWWSLNYVGFFFFFFVCTEEIGYLFANTLGALCASTCRWQVNLTFFMQQSPESLFWNVTRPFIA